MTVTLIVLYAVGACVTFGVIMSANAPTAKHIISAAICSAIWPVVWLVAIGVAIGKWGRE